MPRWSALVPLVGVLSLAALPALAQEGLVVPREYTADEAPGALNTLVRDRSNPRTFQQRWLAGDLAPSPFVVPSALANTVGTFSSNVPLRGLNAPATYQFRVPASQLASIPIGAEIDRIAFRIDNGADWPPPGGAQFDEYRITVAQDANPGLPLAPVFAANQLNPVLVRRGALIIPEATYPGGASGSLQPFGREIRFQRPYAYRGGNLVVTITHTGSSIPQSPVLDAQAAPFGEVIVANSYLATSGSQSTALVAVRLGPARIPVGARISGVRWRLDVGGMTWPISAIAMPNYFMWLSEDANPLAPLSATFTENELRTALVRAGTFTILPLAFPGGGAPNPFGPNGGPDFFAAGFIYPGGNLIFRATHEGSDTPNNTRLLDAGFGDALSATSFNAGTGSAANSVVTRVLHCYSGGITLPLDASNTQLAANSDSVLQAQPRTYQVQFTADQLVGVEPGQIITEVQFRSDPANNPATWPPADLVLPEFEITLSQAAGPIAGFSSVPAENLLNPVVVRTGPLTIPSGTLRQDSGVRFDLRIPVAPYQYRGGDLVLTLTHRGQAGSNWLVDARPADSRARAGAANAFRATQTSPAPVLASRFIARDPEPADVLYTSGSLVNRPLAGPLSSDFLLQPGNTGFQFAGQFSVADPFSVPAPFGWLVTGAELALFGQNALPGDPLITDARIDLWRGIPRAPGSTIIATGNAITSNLFANIYTGGDVTSSDQPLRRVRVAFPSPVTLGPGEYFLARNVSSAVPVFALNLADACARQLPGRGRLASSPTGPFDPILAVDGTPFTFAFKILGEPNPCIADLNFDGTVDFNDLLEFLNLYNGNAPLADLNADGVIDFNDLLEYLNRYNAGC